MCKIGEFSFYHIYASFSGGDLGQHISKAWRKSLDLRALMDTFFKKNSECTADR